MITQKRFDGKVLEKFPIMVYNLSHVPVCWNWQTRWTQNPLPAMACGFKSRHRHHHQSRRI